MSESPAWNFDDTRIGPPPSPWAPGNEEDPLLTAFLGGEPDRFLDMAASDWIDPFGTDTSALEPYAPLLPDDFPQMNTAIPDPAQSTLRREEEEETNYIFTAVDIKESDVGGLFLDEQPDERYAVPMGGIENVHTAQTVAACKSYLADSTEVNLYRDKRLKNLMENLFIHGDSVIVQFGKTDETTGEFHMTRHSAPGSLALWRWHRGLASISVVMPKQVDDEARDYALRFWAVPQNPLHNPYSIGKIPTRSYESGVRYFFWVSLVTLVEFAMVASSDIKLHLYEFIKSRVIEQSMAQAIASRPADEAVPVDVRNLTREEALLCRYTPLAIGTRYSALARLGALILQIEQPVTHYQKTEATATTSALQIGGDPRFFSNPYLLAQLGLPDAQLRDTGTYIVHPSKKKLDAHVVEKENMLQSALALVLRGYNIPEEVPADAIDEFKRIGEAMRQAAVLRQDTLPFARWRSCFGNRYRNISKTLAFSPAAFDKLLHNYYRSEGRYQLEQYLKWPANVTYNKMPGDAGSEKETYIFNMELPPDGGLDHSCRVLAKIVTIVASHAIAESMAILQKEFFTQATVRMDSATGKVNAIRPSAFSWYQLTAPEKIFLPGAAAGIEYRIKAAEPNGSGTITLEDQRDLTISTPGRSRAVGDHNNTATSANFMWKNTRTPLEHNLSLFNGQDDVLLYQKTREKSGNKYEPSEPLAKILVKVMRFLWFHFRAQSTLSNAEILEFVRALGDEAPDATENLIGVIGLDHLGGFVAPHDSDRIQFICKILVGIVFHSHLMALPRHKYTEQRVSREVELGIILDRFEQRIVPAPQNIPHIFRGVLKWLYQTDNDIEALTRYEALMMGVTADADDLIRVGDSKKYPLILHVHPNADVVRAGGADAPPTPVSKSGGAYEEIHPRNWTALYYSRELPNFIETFRVLPGTNPRNYLRFLYSGFNVDRSTDDPSSKVDLYDLPSTVVDFVTSLRGHQLKMPKGEIDSRCLAASLASQHRLAEVMQACYLITEMMQPFEDATRKWKEKEPEEMYQNEWMPQSLEKEREEGEEEEEEEEEEGEGQKKNKRKRKKKVTSTPTKKTAPKTDAPPSQVWTYARIYGGPALTSLAIQWLRRFLYFGKLQMTTVMDAYYLELKGGASPKEASKLIVDTLELLMKIAILFGNSRHVNLVSYSLVQNVYALSMAFHDAKGDGESGNPQTTLGDIWEYIFGGDTVVEVYSRAGGLGILDELHTETPLDHQHLIITRDEMSLMRLRTHIADLVKNLFDETQAPFAFPQNSLGRPTMLVGITDAGGGRESLVDAVLGDLQRGAGLAEYYLAKHITKLDDYAHMNEDHELSRFRDVHWAGFQGWEATLQSGQSFPERDLFEDVAAAYLGGEDDAGLQPREDPARVEMIRTFYRAHYSATRDDTTARQRLAQVFPDASEIIQLEILLEAIRKEVDPIPIPIPPYVTEEDAMDLDMPEEPPQGDVRWRCYKNLYIAYYRLARRTYPDVLEARRVAQAQMSPIIGAWPMWENLDMFKQARAEVDSEVESSWLHWAVRMFLFAD